MRKIINYFTVFEWCLYLTSVLAIIICFFAFESKDYMNLIGSVIGVTALIFISKGNVAGQIISVIFSVIYGIISYLYRYYGETITYCFMTLPIAIITIINWIKNPYRKNEVKINNINKKEWVLLSFLTILVTVVFYFILKAFNTENLIVSTFSISTSFAAVYLSSRRSKYYAIAYGLNDIVLILLWILASINDISYILMVVCFAAFLANDIYAFINWNKMQKHQKHE